MSDEEVTVSGPGVKVKIVDGVSTIEHKEDNDSDDCIAITALGFNLRIPIVRKEIGPTGKWLILSAAASLFVIALAFAWSIVK